MPDNGGGKLEIWRVENFELQPWPKEKYGEFYSGDSFVLLYTYLVNDKENFIIYFWQGLESSQVHTKGLILLSAVFSFHRCAYLPPHFPVPGLNFFHVLGSMGIASVSSYSTGRERRFRSLGQDP